MSEDEKVSNEPAKEEENSDEEESDSPKDKGKEKAPNTDEVQRRIRKLLKLGIVGDGTVGKTCLLLSYVTDGFVDDYVPTVFDNFSVIEDHEGDLVSVSLWDNAGQEDFAQLRTTTCYAGTDVFLLCYSVVHPESFDNVEHKWLIELKESCPNTPFLLVGTKIDMRVEQKTIDDLKSRGLAPITTQEGEKKAKELKAEAYMECSAKSGDKVKSVFQAAVAVIMEREKKRRIEVEKLAKKEAKKEEKAEKKTQKKIDKEQKKEEKQKKK